MLRVMEQMPHILVVDDDREIRDLLARFLEKHQMRVVAVRDAKEARRAWSNGHYQLVVLDLITYDLKRNLGLKPTNRHFTG